jgi:hypothetical protein
MAQQDRISVRQLLAEVNTLPVENFVVEVKRDGKDLILSPEALSALLKVDTNGRLHGLSDTSGQVQTNEANSAGIKAGTDYLGAVARGNANALPLMWEADGTVLNASYAGWQVFPGIIDTADASGNIGVAADLIAAVAAKRLDVYLCLQANTTGSYLTKFVEDPTGTPAAATPDYTAGLTLQMVAGYPYWLRMTTITDNVGFGFDAGTNGDWPNNAIVTYTGWYREV